MARSGGGWFGVAVLSVALLGLGCSGGGRCETDADCDEGFVCSKRTLVCVARGEVPPDEEPGGPAFTLQVSPAALAMNQGDTKALRVDLVREEGFTGAVSLALKDAPEGLSIEALTIPQGAPSTELLLHAADGAALGSFSLTVEGSSEGKRRTASIALTVNPKGSVSIDFSSPAANAFVRTSVELVLEVSGGEPDRVEILRNGGVLATLTARPFQFTWDTSSEAESIHTLQARAHRGEVVSSSPQRTVTVDRTAPRIVTRSPAPDATGVRPGARVTVDFSEPLLPATVTPDSAKLAHPVLTLASVPTLSDGDTRLTLTPATPFPLGTRPSVALAGTITDRAGNPLESALWTFHVPVLVDVGGPLVIDPGPPGATGVGQEAAQIVDSKGRVLVAWAGAVSNQSVIRISRWTGSAWEDLGQAIFPGMTVHDAPSIAVDPNDVPHIAWVGHDGFSRDILAAKMTAVGTWTSLPVVQNYTAADVAGAAPSIAFDGNAPVVAWAETQPSGGQLRAARLGTNGAWSALAGGSLAAGYGRPAKPRLLAAAGHPLTLTFRECLAISQPTCKVFVRRWNGFSWLAVGASSVQASATSGSFPAPVTSLDASGAPITSWTELSQAGSRHLAFRFDGSEWRALGTEVFSDPTASGANVRTFLSNGSALMAVHGESFGGEVEIAVSAFNGSSWRKLERYEGFPGGDALQFEAIPDGKGGAFLGVLEKTRDETLQLYLFALNRDVPSS